MEKENLNKGHRDAIDHFMKNLPEVILNPNQKNAPDLFKGEFIDKFRAAIPELRCMKHFRVHCMFLRTEKHRV